MRRSRTSSAEQQARGNFTPPPRTAVPPAAKAASPPAAGSSSRFSPRNWRVPTRLNAILLIPVMVGLVMGGFQVKASVDTWQQAQDAERTALLVRAASDYGQALLNERDLTAQPLLTNKRDSPVVVQARAATDEAARKFNTAVQDMPSREGLERRLALFRSVEPNLAELRKTAFTAGVETPDKSGGNGGPVATEEGYVPIEHTLMEFSNDLGFGSGNSTSYGRTVYALQLAKGAGSLQRSIGMHLLVRPSQKADVKSGQAIAFSSYAYLEDIAIGEFVSGGTEADMAQLQAVMKEKTAEGAKKLASAQQQAMAAGEDFTAPPSKDGSVLDGMVAAIATGDNPEQLASRGVTPEAWMAATTAKFDGYTEVENDLIGQAVSDAAQISDSARNSAITTAAIVVIALLAAFVLASMMARQLSRSMLALRTAAFGVAEQRLPMLVDQLSRAEPGRVDTRVQPIPIDSRDEIGEVARAFDQVHREAVRLAAEQAMLRGNVNAIFTNLSRRNQSLIEGQLTLISDLENNEGDPDQLENLFRLDHLATRMRRNGENLLVLAGEEPGRRWNQPVPLVDVLRAAASEVESYERIELTGVPETEIHGQSVTDLVHLLAELLENATTFSSPQTKVRVTATRLPDGRVMIEIHDKGIGLTAEDFADINHKLANPPTVDAAVSQRMGLFVVGRLSERHGVRVQLRPSGEQAGTTSLVMLPDAITHGGGGTPAEPAPEFSVTQIMPDQQPPAQEQQFQTAPMLTAAELGFDDSRYEQPPDEAQRLNPVDRSQKREERRAALGTPPLSEQPLFQDQVHGQYREEPPSEAPYAPQPPAAGAEYAPASYAEFPAQPYPEPTAYPAESTASFPAATPPAPADAGFYPEGNYQAPPAAAGPYENSFAPPAQQGEWAESGTYQNAYEAEQRTEPESVDSAPENAQERVGFDRPGPSPSASHALTDAGLPRRGSGSGGGRQGSGQSNGAVGDDSATSNVPSTATGSVNGSGATGTDSGTGTGTTTGGGQSETAGADDWRSRNDERWQRAEKLREPKAGGVTISGLPRRVPKANLVEGAAEQTPQTGPSVSRAPEDIRGRLSSLRRGVERGRAGGDTNGPGHGPGSTYNQER
ncbi:sensor histidine kinase [Streptomyces paludis]|uniref:histidine kinase n=1 Tax=Streptomyces paludis TaxID=2282738 RepID=A0A345HUX7_9ACTN|nr:nitrate- and nitrite sensing domain-containing protein [Streptomyces paludis]AXG80501.1 HAMP domain-containing protein [Streptomyces paludis]